MGSPANKDQHQVNLSSFSIGATEVTQAQYKAVMGTNPSHFKGDDLPAESMSWYDAVAYCNKLSEKEGFAKVYAINGKDVTADWNAKGYRLPTEAEWEYAAKGGQSGAAQNVKYSGSDNQDQVAWYSGNSGKTTHPVGQKAANGLGLYDMSGNVSEWCWDLHGNYSSGIQSDPLGVSSGGIRVFRGGSWYVDSQYLRSAHRSDNSPDNEGSLVGFRVARRP